MFKKILSIFIIINLIFQLRIMSFATTLQQQQDELQEQLTDATNEKKEVKKELSSALQQIDDLEAEIEENEEKIDAINKQLSTLNKEIKELKVELEKTQKEYDKKEEYLKEKIIADYENGKTTYLDVLLNSKGILEFISNYYLLSEILQNDTNVLESIEEKKNKIEQDKSDLEMKQREVKTKKAEQEKAKVLLANQKSQKESKVFALSEEEKKLQKQIEEYKADLAKVEKEIAEQAAKAGNRTTGKIYSGGALTWPCPNYSRISSYFGYRSSPGGGVGSTNHKGIDLAASRGSNIVSSADGTVIKVSKTCTHDYAKTVKTKCSCGGGYGNYIMINHGNGLVTMYAHCSTISVTIGQDVSAGQKIATVGNTGYSTGSHLHYGVLLNGNYVNPASYLGI